MGRLMSKRMEQVSWTWCSLIDLSQATQFQQTGHQIYTNNQKKKKKKTSRERENRHLNCSECINLYIQLETHSAADHAPGALSNLVYFVTCLF